MRKLLFGCLVLCSSVGVLSSSWASEGAMNSHLMKPWQPPVKGSDAKQPPRVNEVEENLVENARKQCGDGPWHKVRKAAIPGISARQRGWSPWNIVCGKPQCPNGVEPAALGNNEYRCPGGLLR